MTSRKTAIVILAAGKGTRMKSSLPKVLHPVGGRAMVNHVLSAVAGVAPDKTVVVLGAGMDPVRDVVAPAERAHLHKKRTIGIAVWSGHVFDDGFEERLHAFVSIIFQVAHQPTVEA